MVAQQESSTILISPEGIFNVIWPSDLPTICAEEPAERANVPPEPGRISTLCTINPSGILRKGIALPTFASADSPANITSPTDILSGFNK